MYSRKIVERNITRMADNGIRLQPNPLPRVEEMVSHLNSLIDAKGEPKRALSVEEKEFIRNERLLSALDFDYFLRRYTWAIVNQGGLARIEPWESQTILLEIIGQMEEEMEDRLVRGETVDGILVALHKARQLGATLIGRALTVHRLITVKHIRALAASLDDDKILELYDRDKTIIDNLPWWMRPSIGFDEKANHIYFDKLASRVIYQTANQKTGMGQGRANELGHITEVASFPAPEHELEHQYFPTIPQSKKSLVLLETTAQGRQNWWHGFCTRVRRKELRRWKFVFIPWYAEKSKYRVTPHDGWKPSDVAMMHAKKVYETSSEFVGHPLYLSREQLYWWESTRAEYQSSDSLNIFFSNYPSTPEESFQHFTRSAFSYETLERFRNQTQRGTPYDIRSTPRSEKVA